MNKKYKFIGMRNVKTAIAVALSVLIARMFSLESPFYTAIAAIISMQDTVEKGFKAGKDRMLGTLAGAMIGIIVCYAASGNIIVISFGLIILITTLNFIKLKDSISIAGVVYCAINLNLHGESGLTYAIYRTSDTLIGVAIAICINKFIFPPNKNNTKIILNVYSLVSCINALIDKVINFNEVESLNEALNKIIIVQNDINFVNKKNIKDEKNISIIYAQKIVDLSINIISYLNIYRNDLLSLNSTDFLDKNEEPFVKDCNIITTKESSVSHFIQSYIFDLVNQSISELNEFWNEIDSFK